VLVSRGTLTRPGISLMEVLISLAIFLMSLAVLGQLIGLASNQAIEIQQRSLASQMCESKLAELSAGILPLTTQQETPFEEDPNYQWSILVQPQGQVDGLYQVTVVVSRPRPDGSQLEVSLSRLMIDPSLMGSTQDVPGAIPGTEESGTGIGTGTTGSTSGGLGGGM
jgi:general secretion pathway protein I